MNIATQETFDLSNCEREPIHRLGRVQSHGALMTFSADWLLMGYSENLGTFCGRDLQQFLGTNVSDIILPSAVSKVTNAVLRLEYPDQCERILSLALFRADEKFDISMHLSGDLLIIEFEPARAESSEQDMDALRTALRGFNQATGVTQLCEAAAKSVAKIIGFDRVMVYRFHHDHSGEVIAEYRSRDVDSFLGLRYPASDIPSQARALYKRSITRIVADLDDEGAEILPLGSNIDLSLAVLRSVSPLHIEYLRNMGVKASFSISIIIDGELWGLIACHHYSPRNVPLGTRTYAELFGESFSMELRSRLDKEGFVSTDSTRHLHMQMMAGLDPDLPLIENLRQHGDRLKGLIKCSALVVMVDDQHLVIGDPVSSEDVALLAKGINSISSTNITAVDSISNWMRKDLTIADRFAGFLAVPISRRPRDLLIFLRREESQSVVWAGNPDKPVELGPNGSRLTPRKSFAAWTELRSGYCAPWTAVDMNLASQIKSIMLEVIVRNIDDRNRLQSQAQQQQDMLIHELNHRVRNILGLINSIVGQTATSVSGVDEFKTIVVGRIQALALAQNMLTERNWSHAPLAAILSTEFDAFAPDRSRVRVSGPDIELSPKAFTTMTLVIHELITNATKYGALATSSGIIDLEYHVNSAGGLEMHWRESGVTIEERPARRGFGSLIIERAMPFDLQGEAEVHYERSGLRARFMVPAAHVHFVTGNHSLPEPSVSSVPNEILTLEGTPSSDRGSALVVEDNMIIAIDEETVLKDLGFGRVEICSSVASAIEALAHERFDFAILDINLGRENSEPVAVHLEEQGVPYIFATGYAEGKENLRQRFTNASIISKPFTSEQLIETVQSVLSNVD